MITFLKKQKQIIKKKILVPPSIEPGASHTKAGRSTNWANWTSDLKLTDFSCKCKKSSDGNSYNVYIIIHEHVLSPIPGVDAGGAVQV